MKTSPRDTARTVAGPLGAERLRVGFRGIEERQRVLDWLNAGLRDARPGRLVSEYPLLFSQNASVLHFTHWSGARPVSHCVLWAVTFRVGVHRLRAGMISLVYTDPEARGRGLAREVVAAASARAADLELGFVLLWSEVDRLYQSLGYVPAGAERLIEVDEATLERARAALPDEGPEAIVEPARAEDWIAIERLRGHRTAQLELDPGELVAARRLPDVVTRVARRGADVSAFAMLGRGDDFRDVVHEWSGPPGDVVRCLQALRATRDDEQPIRVMAPAAGRGLDWALRRAGARGARQSLGWMRVASPRALARDLEAIWARPIGLEIARREPAGALQIRSGLGAATLPDQTLLTALFGGADERTTEAALDVLGSLVGPANRALLPIPFYVWGLESI